MLSIPDFKSTNEAVAFGKVASSEEVEELKSIKIKYDVKFKRCMGEKDFDEASIVATKSQFCREATEVYLGIFNGPVEMSC